MTQPTDPEEHPTIPPTRSFGTSLDPGPEETTDRLVLPPGSELPPSPIEETGIQETGIQETGPGPRHELRMRTVVLGLVLLVVAGAVLLDRLTTISVDPGGVVLALMIGGGLLLIAGARRS
jgi:hypothetical protein